MASAKFDPATGVISAEVEGHARAWAIPDFASLPRQVRDLCGLGASLILRNTAALSATQKAKLEQGGKDVAKIIRDRLDAVVDKLERGEYEYASAAKGGDDVSTAVLTLALQILRRASIAAGRKPEGSDAADVVLAEYKALPSNAADAKEKGLAEDCLTRAGIRGGSAFKSAVVRAREQLGIADEDSGF
jgi:hypothetical protein